MIKNNISSVNKTKIGIDNSQLAIIIFGCLFFAWVLVRNAWAGDDSFISMRVIDNFVNGYGLVWNVGERVQVFTHPLWVLLLIPVYKIIHDPYSSIFWVSLFLSLGTFIIILVRFANSKTKKLIVPIFLSLSAAFIDYCSSGLENPLTHFILIVFLVIWLTESESFGKLFVISFLAAIATVNRYDTVLFFIPALIYSLYTYRKTFVKSIFIMLLGFLPVILWEIFSLYYYGFLFPNTYYAKLSSVNLPANWFALHGWEYFKTSILWDPITLSTIIAAIFLMIIKPNRKIIFINIGVLMYLGYVFSIGGDFMSGRFLSSTFMIMFVQIISFDYETMFKEFSVPIFSWIIIVLMLMGLASKNPPLMVTRFDQDKTITKYGIANEKLFYFQSTSWLNRRNSTPIFIYGREGQEYRISDRKVVEHSVIGFLGYYTGPKIYIIDYFTLPDALRARLLPVEPFRIGHLHRPYPDGYVETIKDSFNNHIKDPSLHEYYDKLDILIHQDLATHGRFQEIINFNLGKYDYLLENYSENID